MLHAEIANRSLAIAFLLIGKNRVRVPAVIGRKLPDGSIELTRGPSVLLVFETEAGWVSILRQGKNWRRCPMVFLTAEGAAVHRWGYAASQALRKFL